MRAHPREASRARALADCRPPLSAQVLFCSAGMQLLSCGSDGCLKLWTVRTNSCVATYDAHGDKVWALAASSEEGAIAIATGAADSLLTARADGTLVEPQAAVQERQAGLPKGQACSNAVHRKQVRPARGRLRPSYAETHLFIPSSPIPNFKRC